MAKKTITSDARTIESSATYTLYIGA